jgi:hypothetical protein
MAAMTNMPMIHESPDRGRTVYVRRLGNHDERTRIENLPLRRPAERDSRTAENRLDDGPSRCPVA